MERNVIHNECCLLTMAALSEGCIDLVVTSPPYDKIREYGRQSWDFERTAYALFRVLKEGGALVWVVRDQRKDEKESCTSLRQALYFVDKVGFGLYNTMIFHKDPRGGISATERTYHQCFEYMFVFSKGRLATVNLIRDRKNKWLSPKGNTHTVREAAGGFKRAVWKHGSSEYGKRGNVWYYLVGRGHSTKDLQAHEHPAIMSDKMARDHILSWSNKGDLVYDPFLGSGTTALMAREHGRDYLGSEIHKKYYDLSQRRLKSIFH